MMSDDSGKSKKLSLSGSRLTLGGLEAGQLRATPGGAGRRTVQVEVRRKRAPAAPHRAATQKAEPAAAPQAAPEAAPAPAPEAGAEDRLTAQERAARVRALQEGMKKPEADAPADAAAEAPVDAAEAPAAGPEADAAAEPLSPAEARRAAELAELKEIEAEEERRRDEEARKHSEANARRAAEARQTAPSAPAPSNDGADLHSRRRRQADDTPSRRPAPARRDGPGRRQSGKMTITQALSGDDQRRQRSLASVRRQREKARMREDQQPQVKQVRDVIVPDTLTVTGGARYYDVKVDLEGAATSAFCKLNSPIFGANAGVDPANQTNIPGCGGTNLSLIYGEDNTFGNPDKARAEGVIFKGTVTWTPTRDLLFYATYSEGFRPGLLNRPGGAQGPGGFTVPFELETDDVQNYELGWKTELFDRQLRLNGSAFYVDVSDLQTTIFDPGITNLFFADNAANAEIKGVEAEFTYAPYSISGLTVAGAISILDTEITEKLTPTDDIVVGSDLAYAPSFQGNLRVRYEWDLSDTLEAFIQPQVSHSASKFTDIIQINRLELDSYTLFDLSVGVSTANYKFELYGENLTDERAQVSGNFNFDRARITVNRPLTVGVRATYNY